MKHIYILTIALLGFTSAQTETLWTDVSGDTVTFHHDETYRNCGVLFSYDVQMGENNTLTITEVDTGEMAWCNCTFDLSLTLDGFSPGNWTAHFYAIDQDQFGDTTYYGNVDFTIQSDWLIESEQTYCGIVDDTTESLWINTEGQNLHLDWALYTNCCIESTWESELVADTFYVTMIDTGAPCDCECSIMLSATFGPFLPGDYTLNLMGWPEQPNFTIYDSISTISQFQSACYQNNYEHIFYDDSASFGVFIFDYTTGSFEKGTTIHVAPSTTYDGSVPFIFQSLPAVDEGWNWFQYTETNETIFFASIVWMGLGQISDPEVFYPADYFSVENNPASDPDSLEYWYYNEIPLDNDSLPGTADSAFQQLQTLSLVHQFSEEVYSTLVYLYTPTVGETDFSVAKWIFFLFRNAGNLNTDKNTLPIQFGLQPPFPNPFNPNTTIRFSVETQRATSLHIFDITGRVIETLVDGIVEPGNHEIQWNASSQPSGIYFAKMISGDFTQTQKLILLK